MQTLLDDEHCCDLLRHAATLLARADIPGPVAEALRLGRLTALRKSNGRVRGIVTGDVFRRLVARTLAQQVGEEVEQATAPFPIRLVDQGWHGMRGAPRADPHPKRPSCHGGYHRWNRSV